MTIQLRGATSIPAPEDLWGKNILSEVDCDEQTQAVQLAGVEGGEKQV